MPRQSFTLINDHVRQNACRAIMEAPQGARVEVKEQKRSSEQNDKLHAMIRDVSRQRVHYGQRLSESQWKLLFLDALNAETRLVPKLFGPGFVALGRSSSDLGVREMADLIELVTAYGAEHGVVFSDQVAA